ncbi:MAG TPA: protoporphyrinogen oxidase HemJ [Rhizomicrobium sp.]|nr:protoporphyrinogen oxidase HemJ [Rhizomicrobium sp.]
MDALRDTLSNYIPWILAFHIIAVIAWMSAMLYLPRLFVYHTEVAPGSESSERFKVMERRLLKGIMNPSMIAVWILGPLLAWLTGAYMDTWLHIKFALVIILSAMHGLYVRRWRDFANDRNTHSARYYRIINEVPAVLMVLIVILVKVQPFGD